MKGRSISFYQFILCFFLGFVLIPEAEAAFFQSGDEQIDFSISVLEDKERQLDVQQVSQLEFNAIQGHSANLGLTESTYWFKLDVRNSGSDSTFFVYIQNANINELVFYDLEEGVEKSFTLSDSSPVYKREFNIQFPLFKIDVQQNSHRVFFLKARGRGVMELPVYIGKASSTFERIGTDQLYFGVYSGIILVMILYNFFLYLSTTDRQYLYYVLYISVVGLTQACLKGYSTKFLWPDSNWLIVHANHVITVLSGIFSILFSIIFLRIKYFLKTVYVILLGAIGVHLAALVIYLSGAYIEGQHILQFNTGLGSILVLFSGFYIFFKKNYKPALFFSLAWSFFLSGVVIYVLKDINVLTYSSITSNAILIGSSLEAAFLSFALADKINVYKKEKEDSQARAMEILREKEQLVREQNVVLEQKVTERTHELEESNESLQKTLNHLKETQAQLVEAEKMASLGQLTAGVAHEINNPINFVTSNVAPLKRDIAIVWDTVNVIREIALADLSLAEKESRISAYQKEQDIDYLKTEIDFLLKGMYEGANRTAEIVKSLRIFSRVDEDSLKFADINEGLDSTLVILNSVIREGVEVIKRYADLPLVECYPGKLNQVFLNIITNAIYAINKKYNGNRGGVLEISTVKDDENVSISIQDNGVGMPDDVKEKIFEPFFTTKEVGEGTGLGMSIVYNTIKKHNGYINIESQVGVGTTFVLVIPLKQQIG